MGLKTSDTHDKQVWANSTKLIDARTTVSNFDFNLDHKKVVSAVVSAVIRQIFVI